MPDQTGNSADGRALDLRLSVPAEGDLRGIAGSWPPRSPNTWAPAAADAVAGRKVAGLASQLEGGGSPQAQDIALEFRQVEGELVVEARCNGEASEVRQPLPV